MTSPNPALIGKFLTVQEVAAQLRVTQKTVRRWIASGELHAFSLGSRRGGYRIDPEDLRRYLDARRTSVGQPGTPITPTYTFTHIGEEERARPKTAVALRQEHRLYALVLAREALVHERQPPYMFTLREGPDQIPPAPRSAMIERLSITVNDVFCPYCGELTADVVVDWYGNALQARCRRCKQEWHDKYLPPPCRPGCDAAGHGIGFGTALEFHPRSLKQGRVRAAYGVGYCFDCDLGILYRWNAYRDRPQITLIHWLTPSHRTSMTLSPGNLVRR